MSTDEQELVELRIANRRLTSQMAEREQEVHDLRQQNEELRAKVEALQARVERMTRRLYGASSERHHPGQQRIDLGEATVVAEVRVDVDAVSIAAASASASVTVAPTTSAISAMATSVASSSSSARRPRPPGSHPGRRRPPVDTEIVEQDVTVPEHERLDEHRQPLPLLGWRVSDKWDFQPGKYLIRRIRRAIYGRPFSVAQDRVVANMPPMLIPRGAMTDAAVIQTVVEKFADHLPLYRQADRATRSGFPLSRATLVNHVAAVADAMMPIVAVLSDQVRHASYLHLDDTPVRMLDPGRGRDLPPISVHRL